MAHHKILPRVKEYVWFVPLLCIAATLAFPLAKAGQIPNMLSKSTGGVHTPAQNATPEQDACSAQAEPTEKQRLHGKIHKEYQTGRDLCEQAAVATGDFTVQSTGLRELPAVPPNPQGYPDWFLRVFAYDADAVVVGVMKSKSSALVEDRSFIFSDFQMEVQEVLKDSTAAHILPNTEITVTRPGGTLELKGKVVRAIDVDFKPFEIAGRYLLFLHFIPDTGAYRAFSEQSFELSDRGAAKLTGNAGLVLPESRHDAKTFIDEVRAAVANAASWSR